MPRRKPFSAKQRKAQLQDKRATKRGDEPLHPPSSSSPSVSGNPKTGSRRPQRSEPTTGDSSRLQSRFIALSTEYLDQTRDLAHAIKLTRPIPSAYSVFPVDMIARDGGRLKCPSRPKFRYGQTKKEVERNEEGWFKRWLGETEGVVRDWIKEKDIDDNDNQDGSKTDDGGDEPDRGNRELWPRSPSWFETNLEVWRQL